MIFVTGGSGFIGRHVVRQLLGKGEDVLVLARQPEAYRRIGDETVIAGDLASPEQIEEQLSAYSAESCIHLAWKGIPDYSYEMSEQNLHCGINLLHLCRKCGIRNLTITGSCWEYARPSGKVSVSAPLGSDNAFKCAKNALHLMAHAFCEEHLIHLNWMRLFYVYGPGQKKESLLPYILASLSEGRQPALRTPYQANDYIYVEDAADAIIKAALHHNFPETLNVGTGKAVRAFDILRMAAECFGCEIDAPGSAEADSSAFYADAKEMKDAFAWSARTSIHEGIRSMIGAIKER